MEEKAARAYDLAALKYWGPSTHINFPVWFYTDKCLSLVLGFQLLKSPSFGVLAARKLSIRTGRNEEHEPARICCSLEEVRFWVIVLLCFICSLDISGWLSGFCFDLLCRKSSGFSRGASMYRGVTRFFIGFYLASINCLYWLNSLFQLDSNYGCVLITFPFAGITNMEDGKLGLAELQETRTFILGHSVSSCIV